MRQESNLIVSEKQLQSLFAGVLVIPDWVFRHYIDFNKIIILSVQQDSTLQ